jgi:glucosamine--fructose-6-phosphate aminotransferase (isomerizing)
MGLRWATHGRPSDVNAHPHTGCEFAVHNGIIENFRRPRELQGRAFASSETDTELLAHIIARVPRQPADAVERPSPAEGACALVVMSEREPEPSSLAQDQPLRGRPATAELASDIPAVLHRTGTSSSSRTTSW